MGRPFVMDLEGNFYSCKYCCTPLALANDVISESFQCQHGRAFLLNKVVNVTFGEEEERDMIGGLHTVVDTFCVKCGSNVGWKFEAAEKETEQYKIGKFILERIKVLGPGGRPCVPPRVTWGGVIDRYGVFEQRNRNRNRNRNGNRN